MDKLTRQAGLCALLEDAPGVHTVEGLAGQLGVTVRTVQRDLHELQRRGAVIARERNRLHLRSVPAELLEPAPPATEGEARHFTILKFVYEEPGGFAPAGLCQAVARLHEVHERTIARDLDELTARGLVEQRDGRCYPGRAFLPKLRLTADQALALLSYLELQRQLLPRKRALLAAWEKLRGALFGEAAQIGAGEAGQSATCVVKGRYYQQAPEIEALVDLLDCACQERRRVRFSYRPANGNAGQRLADPLGLAYYWFHDAWYLVAGLTGEGGPGGELRHFRLDRMDDVAVTGEAFEPPAEFDLREHLAPCWGIEHGELHQVSIRFYDELNVLARVKRETAHRERARLVAEEGGTYLYTDEVAGLNELRVWVRSFGSSAEVLSPAALREELLESARGIIARHTGAPAATGGLEVAG